MNRAAPIGLALGIACLAAILAWEGVGEVARALGSAGAGLLIVAAFHLLPLGADAAGWRALLGGAERPSFWVVMRSRWIGEAVNSLLPVMQIGGAVVRARLLAQAGVGAAIARASVVVDVTLVVGTQVLFTLLGLAVLIATIGGGDVRRVATIGTVIMAVAVAAFVVAQRRGLFEGLVAGLAVTLRRPDWQGFAERAGAIDARVAALYAEPRRLLASGSWHLASWIIGTGETWLALWFLGHPIDLLSALLLESLGQAIRAAAFAVPAGLGVQEGGYWLLGSTLGLPPDTAIALSLAKRVRELCIGLPGLALWQAVALRDARRDLPRRPRPAGDAGA